jgi:hypothetical protein
MGIGQAVAVVPPSRDLGDWGETCSLIEAAGREALAVDDGVTAQHSRMIMTDRHRRATATLSHLPASLAEATGAR